MSITTMAVHRFSERPIVRLHTPLRLHVDSPLCQIKLVRLNHGLVQQKVENEVPQNPCLCRRTREANVDPNLYCRD